MTRRPSPITRAVPLALLLCSGVARAQDDARIDLTGIEGVERVLIHADLRAEPVRLLSLGAIGAEAPGTGLGAFEIVYRDSDGLVRTLSSEGVLALTTPSTGVRRPGPMSGRLGAGQPPLPHVVTRTTGERAVGRLRLSDEPGESVTLVHERLGIFETDLESLASVTFGLSPDAATPSGQADRVVFVNGDAAEGFVLSIGRVVTLENAEGGARSAPITSVRSVTLANPGESPEGSVVWLGDGSILATEALWTPAPGRMGLRAARAERSPEVEGSEGALSPEDRGFALEDLDAIVFDAGALRPLSTMAWTPAGAGPSPVIGAGDRAGSPLFAEPIELPGPTGVRWALPAGATWFAARAELPPTSARWGDFELIVSASGVGLDGVGAGIDEIELARVRLNAERDAAELSAPLPPGARELVVRLDEGAYGPVQDRAVLRRAVVRVERAGGDG